jgi:hypothetical protein
MPTHPPEIQITAYSARLKTLLALFLAGMSLLNGFVFWSARKQVVAGHPDFSIFYTASLMLTRAQGHVLYSNSLQWQVQHEFSAAADERDGPLPYNHPPFEAALFLPFAYLSYLHAYEVWVALNLLLLGGVVFFMRPRTQWLDSAPLWLPLLAALAFFPIAYALMQGQDSILLLAIYCLAYAALRRGQDLRAGLWLGLGLFKFHLVLPFVFILLLRRRWRAVLGVALSGVWDVLLSWVLVGWKELLYYPRYAWEINRHPFMRVIAPTNMANLRGLFTGWKWAPAASPWPEVALLVASLALLLWAARQWEPADSSDLIRWNNGWSVAMIATFLVGYHGYTHDMSILFLPVLLLSGSILETRPAGWYNFALKLGLGLMFFSPVYLILTLHYGQQHLFALVLIGLAATLAAWNASLTREPAAC